MMLQSSFLLFLFSFFPFSFFTISSRNLYRVISPFCNDPLLSMLLLRNHTTFLPSVPITIASPFIESCIRARIVLARTIIKLFDFITFVENSLRSCFLFFFFVTSGELLFHVNDIIVEFLYFENVLYMRYIFCIMWTNILYCIN